MSTIPNYGPDFANTDDFELRCEGRTLWPMHIRLLYFRLRFKGLSEVDALYYICDRYTVEEQYERTS
jgi:hypothetical protein